MYIHYYTYKIYMPLHPTQRWKSNLKQENQSICVGNLKVSLKESKSVKREKLCASEKEGD